MALRKQQKMRKRGSNLEFEDGVSIKEARGMRRQAQRAVKHGRFAGEVVKDLDELRTGERRNKRKKRFWEKKSVQDAAAAHLLTIGAIGAYAGRKHIHGAGKKIAEHLLEDPTLKPTLQRRGDGWYMTKPTSSSVRVHTTGRKRVRRGKYWHERKDNRDKMLGAATLAAVTGIPAAYLLGKRKGIKVRKSKQKPIHTTKTIHAHGTDAKGVSDTLTETPIKPYVVKKTEEARK